MFNADQRDKDADKGQIRVKVEIGPETHGARGTRAEFIKDKPALPEV